MTHSMIDIETLGREQGCCIFSIGAVTFDLLGEGHMEEFYVQINLKDMKDRGFTVDPETVAWWKEQSPEAQKQMFSKNNILIEEALIKLSSWMKKFGVSRVWCQGANFDAPILDAAYNKLNLVSPWKFWEVRDTRTIYDVFGFDYETVERSGVYHNALDDCKHQVVCLQRAFKSLGEVE